MEKNIYVKYLTFRREKVGKIYFAGWEDVCKIYVIYFKYILHIDIFRAGSANQLDI